MAETTYERFLVNLKGGVRRETFQNRKYVVAPAVILTEDVHNGSQGPIFYPGNHLEKSVPAWNLKPIVLYHPEMNGEPISAASINVLESRGLGFVLNTSYANDKLATETWFDEVKTKELEKKLKMPKGIIERLDNGETLELSTGLISELDKIPGEFNGAPYNSSALNHRPDHLAILPDRIGACSIEKGCGCNRMNNQTPKPEEQVEKKLAALPTTPLHNALSHQDIGRRIHKAMADEAGPNQFPGYVEDVFPDGFVYSAPDGKMFHRGYSIDPNSLKVSLGDKPQEVTSHKAYKTLDGKSISKAFSLNEGEKLMADNATPPAAAAPPPPAPIPTPAPINNAPPRTPTLEEYINNAPDEIRDMLSDGLASSYAERTQLITEITANKANQFKQEDLAKKRLSELRAIAALARPAGQPPMPTYNRAYYGGANPPANPPEIKVEPLACPVIDWTKK